MGFVDKVTAESRPRDVQQIVTAMVKAALDTTSVGGGEHASLFTTAPHDIAKLKILESGLDLEPDDIEKIPADIRETLCGQAAKNALEAEASRFTSEVDRMALLLYIQATDPKSDISHALSMQKGAIARTAVEWMHRVQLDKVFEGDTDNPTRFMEHPHLNNMVNALEANMRQFLREKNISQDIAVTLY